MSFFTQDLLERVGRTFVQTTLAVFIVAVSGIVDLGSGAEWKAAVTAGIAGGFAAVTALLSKNMGSSPDDGSAL